MKKNIKLLLICLSVCVVVAVVVSCFLYCNRKEAWSELARNTFAEALKKEVQKRSGMELCFTTWGHADLSSEQELPEEVTVTSEYGKRKYSIPAHKRNHNIGKISGNCGIHSYVLDKRPLAADSLNLVWTDLLRQYNFPGKNIIRVSVTDLEENESQSYSSDSAYINKTDSLTTYYLGIRSEIEVSGFLHIPWWKLFSAGDILLLCAIVSLGFLLPFCYDNLDRLYHRIFIKEVTTTIEVEKTVEKEIFVIPAKRSEAHIYQLDESVLFDADLKTLKKGDHCQSIYPQLATLLRGFLEAEDYKLSTEDIQLLLWPKGDGTIDKVHAIITKLRGCLSRVSKCSVVNENFSYQLKIPHSIEENP